MAEEEQLVIDENGVVISDNVNELICKEISNNSLNADFTTIKDKLIEYVSTYRGLSFNNTLEDYRIFKKIRATLNKDISIIDTKRKQVKKEFIKPYEAFEHKVKDLIAVIEDAKNEIDIKIKNYENSSNFNPKEVTDKLEIKINFFINKQEAEELVKFIQEKGFMYKIMQ